VPFFNGGMGATPVKDRENVLSWPSNVSSTPVEVAERNSPLFFQSQAHARAVHDARRWRRRQVGRTGGRNLGPSVLSSPVVGTGGRP
jgi:hypothetical protein